MIEKAVTAVRSLPETATPEETVRTVMVALASLKKADYPPEVLDAGVHLGARDKFTAGVIFNAMLKTASQP